MPHFIYHPDGRFENPEEPGRFDVCFTPREMRVLKGEFHEDMWRHCAIGLCRYESDVPEIAFVATLTAVEERMTQSERFEYQRHRTRSIVEVLM